MRKIFCTMLACLLMISAAIAESVTQMPYELNLDGETRIGKYTGDIENGIPEGYGIFVTTNPSGYSWHYIGDWTSGLMHGDGAIYWEDGSLELGQYENGHFIFGYFSYAGAALSLYNSTGEQSKAIEAEATEEPAAPEVQYIGNKNSHVFHELTCNSVREMKEKNKVEFYSRDEATGLGYTPCQRCNP